jgi:hypothetical protein
MENDGGCGSALCFLLLITTPRVAENLGSKGRKKKAEGRKCGNQEKEKKHTAKKNGGEEGDGNRSVTSIWSSLLSVPLFSSFCV